MLIPFEQKIFKMSHRMNEFGIPMDLPLVRKFYNVFLKEKERMNSVCQKTYGLNLTQTGKLQTLFEGRMDNLQAATIEKALQENRLNSTEKKILKYRLECNSKALTKLPRILSSHVGGRLKNQLIPFSNITGRWAGALVQPMNFKKPEEKYKPYIKTCIEKDYKTLSMLLGDNFISCLGSCIRATVKAPPGTILFSGDYSQIECRLLLWAAGEEEGLNAFRRGDDLYVELASIIFNVPIDQVTKEQRFAGKQGMLGSGYQIGPVRMKATCAQYGQDISVGLAEDIVGAYRKKYKKVVRMWYAMRDAARKAIEYAPSEVGPFHFYKKEGTVYIGLPSGRRLCYPQMRWGEGSMGMGLYYQKRKKGGIGETYTYGGSLTENGIQAMAFDVCANGMINLDENNLPPFLNIHDQALSQVLPNDDLDLFKQCLESKPGWMDSDFPLETECEAIERYAS